VPFQAARGSAARLRCANRLNINPTIAGRLKPMHAARRLLRPQCNQNTEDALQFPEKLDARGF
jgi:hypothetical protein